MNRRMFLKTAGLTGAALVSGGLVYSALPKNSEEDLASGDLSADLSAEQSLAQAEGGDQAAESMDMQAECVGRRFDCYDYQSLLAQSVTTIRDGSSSRFPQAAVVDQENGKFYITRQTTGNYQDQMIYEYDLETPLKVRTQSVTIGKGVYIEGLVYFHNEAKQICFIVPITKYGRFGIFNFDTGDIEKQFDMPGNYKVGMDNHFKYFICGKNSDPSQDANQVMDGVYIYDFDSVKKGTPHLMATVEFLHDQLFQYKIQGLTMIDDCILFGHGVDHQYLSIMDLNGNLLYMVSHDSKEIISLIGGDPYSSNLQVESEGISWTKEGGVTYPVLFNASQGKASLVKLGDMQDGTKLSRRIFNGYNPFREHAAMRMVQSDGTPAVYVTSGQDFYEAVSAIKKKGIYTFFCNGAAVNAPISRRSVRGTIIVTELANAGMASQAEIRGQDFGGAVWSNYYDTNASEVWKGWSHIGGAYTVSVGNSFDPFEVNPGIYETSSVINAPTQSNEIKIYSIIKSTHGRRQIQCNYTESGDMYYANIQTNGVFGGWRKLAFTT